ncbi:MAG: uracil-DNA glycosylase family protein [Gammaproteobacteria bacterium]
MTDLISVARRLRAAVSDLQFRSPVTHVYNPLGYAWSPHREYLERYGAGRPEVVLVGMNPGPWGMVQTGVPFGDVEMVRNWLGINSPVRRPPVEHPRRPIQGFACRRREVSGQRLWGWARHTFGSPDKFFARFFILNYCPLCFLESSGRNRTPDRLSAAERGPLLAVCDRSLVQSVEVLRPRYLLGVGRFPYGRVAAALSHSGGQLGMVPHPSPASPQANRGWGRLMEAALRSLGIRVP